MKGCGYQVQAGPRGNRQTKTFRTLSAATNWKRDVENAQSNGEVTKTRAPTLRAAAAQWRVDAEAGVALARGRKPYRPRTIRDYAHLLDERLLKWVPPDAARELGDMPLDKIGDVLGDLVAAHQRKGLAPSTVRNIVMPLRAVFRYAVKRKWVVINPTLGLEVPAGSGRRMKIVLAGEIPKFIRTLPVEDRALWATAFYAGLRRGELMALRWEDVDLAGGLIHVHPERGGFDTTTRLLTAPKSEAGGRAVPISGELRDLLAEHRARAGARPRGFVFARATLAGTCRKGMETEAFLDTTVHHRASKLWIKAGLAPVSLHDCRHTFASLAIAAMAARGVFNPKLLQRVMGHSSIQVTYDRYGKLFPGQEGELAEMLDDFIGGDAVRPPVAKAISRLLDTLEDCEPEAALPMVADAITRLKDWQHTHPAASTDPRVAAGPECAATVPHDEIRPVR